jgi:hypothetical protein
VEDALVRTEFEIEIGLHAPAVHMGRHGVPDGPRCELGVAHQELAAFGDFRMQELQDDTFVRRFRGAQLDAACVLDA